MSRTIQTKDVKDQFLLNSMTVDTSRTGSYGSHQRHRCHQQYQHPGVHVPSPPKHNADDMKPHAAATQAKCSNVLVRARSLRRDPREIRILNGLSWAARGGRVCVCSCVRRQRQQQRGVLLFCVCAVCD